MRQIFFFFNFAYDPAVEIRHVRVWNGVGDVVEGVRVDPVVPVHHLLQGLLPLADLRPGE
jgi:hypothetical protein